MKSLNNMSHLVILWVFVHASLVSHSIVSASNSSPYVPKDKIFLNCGALSELSSDTQGRNWITDIGSKFIPKTSNSLISTTAIQDPSIPQVPFTTARIFPSEFTYTFPVAFGRKFVRLYFYPASYANLDEKNVIFDVTSGPYTLLRNFSISQTTDALNYVFIVKEFVLNVVDGKLDVRFKPSLKNSNAYAFINGIEVVSVPNIYDNAAVRSATIVGTSFSLAIDNTTILENFYRLNVGGSNILPRGDTGMFRAWEDDSEYIFGAAFGLSDSIARKMSIVYPDSIPEYIAPSGVYATARTMGDNSMINQNYNLTWIFSVDSGFDYLVRLHFCEISMIISKVNQRVFKIFLNNQTAEDEADVVAWTGGKGNGIPVYKDYVVNVPRGSSKQDMWLALHPNVASKPRYYNAILNGVEIFKVNDSTGNLAGQNPIPIPKQNVMESPSYSSSGISKHQLVLFQVLLWVVLLHLVFFG